MLESLFDSYYPVKFAIFLITPFILQNTSMAAYKVFCRDGSDISCKNDFSHTRRISFFDRWGHSTLTTS